MHDVKLFSIVYAIRLSAIENANAIGKVLLKCRIVYRIYSRRQLTGWSPTLAYYAYYYTRQHYRRHNVRAAERTAE